MDNFHPDNVDEQVEQLLHAQDPSSLDGQMAQHLREVFEEENAIARTVYERLEQRIALEKKGTDVPFAQKQKSGLFAQGEKHMTPYIVVDRGKKTFFTVASTIAAMLIVTVMVGALVTLINQSRQSQTGPATTPVVTPKTTVVYAPTADGIYAIDPQKGKVSWHYTLNNQGLPLLPQSLKVQNGIAYFVVKERGSGPEGSPNGKESVVAVKVGDKNPLWQLFLDQDRQLSSVINGTSLYVSTGAEMGIGPGHIYALDLKKGTLRWKISTDFSAEIGGVRENVLYLAEKNILHAISGQDGHELWSVTNTGEFNTAPLVAGNSFYSFSCPQGGGNILCTLQAYSIDPAKPGHIQRTWSTAQAIAPGPFTVVGSTIYLHQKDLQKVLALDTRQAGKIVWQHPYTVKYPNYPAFGTSPVVANGKVYVGVGDTNATEIRLLAFDATNGQSRWDKPINHAISEYPVINEGALYYRTSDGKIQICTLTNGDVIKEIPFTTVSDTNPTNLTIVVQKS